MGWGISTSTGRQGQAGVSLSSSTCYIQAYSQQGSCLPVPPWSLGRAGPSPVSVKVRSQLVCVGSFPSGKHMHARRHRGQVCLSSPSHGRAEEDRVCSGLGSCLPACLPCSAWSIWEVVVAGDHSSIWAWRSPGLSGSQVQSCLFLSGGSPLGWVWFIHLSARLSPSPAWSSHTVPLSSPCPREGIYTYTAGRKRKEKGKRKTYREAVGSEKSSSGKLPHRAEHKEEGLTGKGIASLRCSGVAPSRHPVSMVLSGVVAQVWGPVRGLSCRWESFLSCPILFLSGRCVSHVQGRQNR